LEGFFPRRATKVGKNNSFQNNFLYCEFQLSIFNSLKVSFGEWGILGVSSPENTQIWSTQLPHK